MNGGDTTGTREVRGVRCTLRRLRRRRFEIPQRSGKNHDRCRPSLWALVPTVSKEKAETLLMRVPEEPSPKGGPPSPPLVCHRPSKQRVTSARRPLSSHTWVVSSTKIESVCVRSATGSEECGHTARSDSGSSLTGREREEFQDPTAAAETIKALLHGYMAWAPLRENIGRYGRHIAGG